MEDLQAKTDKAIKYIQKKAKDVYFYIPKLLKIRAKDGQIIPFIPNQPQQKLRAVMEEQRAKGKPVRIIILKARQMGFSTYTEADCFHQTVTHENFNSFIIAHQDEASTNLYNMFKRFYDKLPEFMKPMRKRNNSKELLFENPTNDDYEKSINGGLHSSVKVATAKNTGTGRSLTLNYVHASEVAFWDNPEETMKSLLQAVPHTANSTVIIESTANGVGDYFYNKWNSAVNNEKGNEFIPLFFAWWEMDEYSLEFDDEEEREEFIEEVNYTHKDEKGNIVNTEEWHLMNDFPSITYEKLKWRRWCIQNNCNGDVKTFYQEYPSYPEEAFQSSGRPVFNMDAIKEYLKHTEDGITGNLEYDGENPIFVEAKSGNLEIWKKPIDGEIYSIGSDVAEGLAEGDYSTAIVLDNDVNVVARMRYHIDPDLHGTELVKLSKYYNEAFLGIEANNHGLTTIKHILNIEDYWNLYYSKIVDKATDTVTEKVGWITNKKTKPLMIDTLNTFIRDKLIGIKDKQTLVECSTYVKDDKGLMNAQTGCHDDLVIALAIALQVQQEMYGECFDTYDSGKYENYESNEDFDVDEYECSYLNNLEIAE